jgi:hypothetical protein
MCPFCLATAAVIAGSVTGTGGVTALITGTILKRNKREILLQEEEVKNGNSSNGVENPEDGVSR